MHTICSALICLSIECGLILIIPSFYVERKGKLKCALSEYHYNIFSVGKITLKPLQKFRDANKNSQAPSIAGLCIKVSTMSVSETQVSGAKYLQVILASR